MCKDCGCELTEPTGLVTHFYAMPMVAVVKCLTPLKNGDNVRIKGATSDFSMTVDGMRNEAEESIDESAEGDLVAFKTPELARSGDKVYIVTAE